MLAPKRGENLGVSERPWAAPTPDGHVIHGLENKLTDGGRCVVFCHGLTRNIDDAIIEAAIPHFQRLNLSTIRFSFYSHRAKARSLTTINLEQMLADFRLVVDIAAKKYSEVFVVAHSFGCIVHLLSEESFSLASAYLDPTCATNTWPDLIESGSGIALTSIGGIEVRLSNSLVDDFRRITPELLDDFYARLQSPILIVHAGLGELAAENARHALLSPRISSTTVAGADHLFSGFGPKEKALKLCAEYFNAMSLKHSSQD